MVNHENRQRHGGACPKRTSISPRDWRRRQPGQTVARDVIVHRHSASGLGFMGCYAALPALRMADQFCQAIVDKVENALDLRPKQVRTSRNVLRKYGNMNSAPILFVLKELLPGCTDADAGSHVCAIAFGPGLTVESAFLKVCGRDGTTLPPAPVIIGIASCRLAPVCANARTGRRQGRKIGGKNQQPGCYFLPGLPRTSNTGCAVCCITFWATEPCA